MLPQAQLLIYSPVVSFQMNTLEYFWMKKSKFCSSPRRISTEMISKKTLKKS